MNEFICSFIRAFNANYGEISCKSSFEEIVLSLVRFKCIPCLLHGLDACSINKFEGKETSNALVNRFAPKSFEGKAGQIFVIHTQNRRFRDNINGLIGF